MNYIKSVTLGEKENGLIPQNHTNVWNCLAWLWKWSANIKIYSQRTDMIYDAEVALQWLKPHPLPLSICCLLLPFTSALLLLLLGVLVALHFHFVVNVSKWNWAACSEVSLCSDLKSCVRWEPGMHLYPRWNRSIWDAERIKVNQTQRACVVLMLRRLIVCVQSVPVLLGRFLPQLLAVICMHSGRRFVLQRRIWPKYNFKGDVPPSVSSAGRIFAEREAFIFVCLLCDTRLTAFLHFFFWRILQFSSGLFCSWMFACVSINIRQVSVQRCWAAQGCNRTTPACEMAQQSTPSCFSLRY